MAEPKIATRVASPPTLHGMRGTSVASATCEPVGLCQGRRSHVGKQRQGQPFESPGNVPIAQPTHHHEQQRRDHRRPQSGRDAGQHRQHFSQSAQVGGDLAGIGRDQHSARAPGDPGPIAYAQHAGQPLPRDHAQPGTHQLHGRQQGKHEDRRPQEAVAISGPGDRIGGDGRRIIVGGAGDHARAQERPGSHGYQESFSARRAEGRRDRNPQNDSSVEQPSSAPADKKSSQRLRVTRWPAWAQAPIVTTRIANSKSSPPADMRAGSLIPRLAPTATERRPHGTPSRKGPAGWLEWQLRR